MKKSICVLLIMTGFSAFALSPLRTCKPAALATKNIKKKGTHKTISPLSDLMIAVF